MEYKNLEEMLEKFEFAKGYTGGGCFFYERRVPESNPFSIVIFTNHNDYWLTQEATEYSTFEEVMDDQRVEYDIYVCETELLAEGENYLMMRADDIEAGHELNNDWTKLQDHIQATIKLSESLNLNDEYVEKYGCSHHQLLVKYKNLDVDEFKTLLMVYEMYAGVTTIDNRITFN